MAFLDLLRRAVLGVNFTLFAGFLLFRFSAIVFVAHDFFLLVFAFLF